MLKKKNKMVKTEAVHGRNENDRKRSFDVIDGKETYLVLAFAVLLFFLEKMFSIWNKEGAGDVVSHATDGAVSFVCPPST